jgi:hypothetical protein
VVVDRGHAAASDGQEGQPFSDARIKQWQGPAARYAKHAITYRAAVVLNAVITWTRQLSDTP